MLAGGAMGTGLWKPTCLMLRTTVVVVDLINAVHLFSFIIFFLL